MASDTDLWLSLKAHQDRYSKMAAKAHEAAPVPQVEVVDTVGGSKIVINRVEMPAGPAPGSKSAISKEGTPGAPTPSHKRVLDQEEFNKKLKAKRAIFSTSRSLSLANFRYN